MLIAAIVTVVTCLYLYFRSQWLWKKECELAEAIFELRRELTSTLIAYSRRSEDWMTKLAAVGIRAAGIFGKLQVQRMMYQTLAGEYEYAYHMRIDSSLREYLILLASSGRFVVVRRRPDIPKEISIEEVKINKIKLSVVTLLNAITATLKPRLLWAKEIIAQNRHRQQAMELAFNAPPPP